MARKNNNTITNATTNGNTNGKFRDPLGNLYYCVKASDGKIFSVTKPSGTATDLAIRIIHETSDCNTNAMVMDDDGGFFWNEAPTFDSFIHAARWLKENVENLL